MGNKGAGSEHAHRVVVGQQHILDGLVGEGADARDQVLRHGRRGGGVAHQHVLVADDHARIGITLGGVGPAVRAELLEGDLAVGQVGLGSEGLLRGGLGHGGLQGHDNF
jgi:hypothetical protein